MSPWSGFRDPEVESNHYFSNGDSSLEEDLESQVWPDPGACIDIPQHIPGPLFFGPDVNTKDPDACIDITLHI